MTLTPEDSKRINDEELCLTEVLSSLAQQITYGSVRLQGEISRAHELTRSIVAARRDVDKQMLASDEAVSHSLRDSKRDEIAQLKSLRENPYFARIILEESASSSPGAADKKRIIEYKLGQAANPDCRIIDWRKAPIAKLYYEYQEGDLYEEEILGRERTGQVLLRNKVDIDAGQLSRLSCKLGNYSRQNGSWQKTSNDLNKRRSAYGVLPDVLQLITAEQFRMITVEARSAVLIQGIAGSGKTTVALYRLSWLLHPDNSDLTPEDAFVIVLSRTLQRYIKDSLQQLKHPEIKVFTFDEWSQRQIQHLALLPPASDRQLKRPAQASSPSVLRLKQSMALVLRIEEYVESLREKIISELDSALPWGSLPGTWKSSFTAISCRRSPVLRQLEELESSLNAVFAGPVSSPQGAQVLAASLALITQKRALVKDYWQHLLHILSRPQSLLSWDDTALLDSELVIQAYQETVENLRTGTIAYADDALLIRLAQLCGQSLLRPDGVPGLMRHIVADEVQDFGAAELACIIYAAEDTTQLTLVGDTDQQIISSAFPGWDRLRAHCSLGEELAQFHSLTVSFRSTLPILQLAEFASGNKRATDGRPGKRPLWLKCQREQRGVREAIAWLQRVNKKFPGSLTAVLCATASEARQVYSLLSPTFSSALRLGDDNTFSFAEGIIVCEIAQVKGLEFPNVLLWNPSANSFPDTTRARHMLYVAMTRAEEILALVTWGNPSPLLPPVDSPIVRGQEVEEWEKE